MVFIRADTEQKGYAVQNVPIYTVEIACNSFQINTEYTSCIKTYELYFLT